MAAENGSSVVLQPCPLSARYSGILLPPPPPSSTPGDVTLIPECPRPMSRPGRRAVLMDPSVQSAMASAVKAELALAEFDAMPEIYPDSPLPVALSGREPLPHPQSFNYEVLPLQRPQQSKNGPSMSESQPSDASHLNGVFVLASTADVVQTSTAVPSLSFPLLPYLSAAPPRKTLTRDQQQQQQDPSSLPLPGALVGRARAERAADFEVEHNWLLKEEAERKAKRLAVTKRKLAIFLPDEDPLQGISSRLEEVQVMLRPRAELSSLLEELPAQQRDVVIRISSMDLETFLKERRRNWKTRNYVRNVFRMVYHMTCLCSLSRRYFNQDDPEAGPLVMRKQRKLYGHTKQPIKSSLSADMQLSLRTNPDHRTAYDLKRVLWILRATKAFQHLFPNEMERELAMVVSYERYDDNRHVAYQGRPADRFYYVLSGRIQLLREYKLSTGCVNKSMGFWNKGMTSDPKELEQGWLRECHLVSKGQAEALILHKDDFIRLQHTVQGPPIDFLGSIDLFKEFPCDQFLHSPEAIEFKYYGQNRIIAKDINRTPWLHVVKSGAVKVVRVQHVLDVQHDRKLAAQSTEELGCGRYFSHADAMLGLLAKQRKMKTMTDMELSLPEVFQNRAKASIEQGKRGKRIKSLLLEQSQNAMAEGGEVPSMTVDADKLQDNDNNKDEIARADVTLPPISKSRGLPSLASSGHHSNGNSNIPTSVPAVASSAHDPFSATARTKNADNVPQSSDGPNNHTAVQRGTFLTREKTDAATGMDGGPPGHYHLPPGVVLGKKAKREPLVRKAYLQLDLLRPGDVFGLDDIARKFRYPQTEQNEGLENLDSPPVTIPEGPRISLVSDGAEVIKINKRFFLQHAQNNTMLRVETMQRSYLSTEEARAILYDKETWIQYKNVLMQRLIDRHLGPGPRPRPLPRLSRAAP